MVNDVLLKCTNKGCLEQIRYSNVVQHALDCPQLEVNCIACHEVMLQTELEKHKVGFNYTVRNKLVDTFNFKRSRIDQ